jgi:hypothetical protein
LPDPESFFLVVALRLSLIYFSFSGAFPNSFQNGPTLDDDNDDDDGPRTFLMIATF